MELLRSILIPLTVVCILTIGAVLLFAHRLQKAHETERDAWRQERSELLTRIQRPEFIPAQVPVDWQAPEQEVDYSNLVGTIDQITLDELQTDEPD